MGGEVCSGQLSVGSQKQKQKLTKQKFRNPEFLVGFDVRPHPCLLPQEKGNVYLLPFSLVTLAFFQRLLGSTNKNTEIKKS